MFSASCPTSQIRYLVGQFALCFIIAFFSWLLLSPMTSAPLLEFPDKGL